MKMNKGYKSCKMDRAAENETGNAVNLQAEVPAAEASGRRMAMEKAGEKAEETICRRCREGAQSR